MDLMAALASGGASWLKDGVMTAVQYYNQKHLNNQAQSDTQENMRLAHQLNQKAQFNSIKNSTAALKAAGLNPALAVGGVQGAAGVSNPAGSAGEAQVVSSPLANDLMASNTLALQSATKENIEAQTDKLKAETAKTNQQVKHTESRDKALSPALRSELAEMRNSTDNPFMRGFLDDFLEKNNEMDLGTLRAFNDTWFDLSQRERDRELDYVAKEMDKKVLSMQYENGAAEALADMPKATRLQIYRNMALMDSQIAQLDAETSLTEDKRAAIRSSVDKMAQEIQSLLHHDPAAMWHAGDISGLGVMLGYEGVQALAHGAGFGAGAAASSRFAGAAAGSRFAGAGSVTRLPSTATRNEVQRQLELSTAEIKALKQAAKSKANNERLGELYREQRDLQERLRKFNTTDYAR